MWHSNKASSRHVRFGWPVAAVVALLLAAPCSCQVSTLPAAPAAATQAVESISIPNSDDVRGYITLPLSVNGLDVEWKSSHPEIVSDAVQGKVAAGVVNRPAPGSEAAQVTLRACIKANKSDDDTSCKVCREFGLVVQPLVELAPLTRYGMANFARSNSQEGQQIYMAASVGNDATAWEAVNQGKPVLRSTKGMHGVRDPSVVRSPEGDRFFLVATDLNVDGTAYGWQGWNWAQSNASRYIEVWESRDLSTWSEQRHVLVAPEEAGMAFAPEAIWDPEIGAYVVYWTSSMYAAGTYYTPDTSDPKGRFPLTRNQALYATTRDFVTFTEARIMSGRPGHGALDSVIVGDARGEYYHRFVCDRTSTGVNTTRYASDCGSEDLYQERARSILATESEWELVADCITHDTMNTTYAEAPLVVRANEGDVRGGGGYYLYADQKWAESPAGQPMEEQLSPYWAASEEDMGRGKWRPIDWTQKPAYELAAGVIRHGHIWAVTEAEHAALRGRVGFCTVL